MTNKSVSFSNLEEDDKLVTFLDYNDFVKKYRSLKFYCPKSYKYVCFHLLKNLKVRDTGKYIASIPTDLIFSQVYGEVQLIYSVINGRIVIEDLCPADFLLEVYARVLDTYKGIPYRNAKDIFKINLILKRKELEELEN